MLNNSCIKLLATLQQGMSIGISGESLRNQALQEALVKKGIITEKEITAAIGEVIKKINEKNVKQQEEAKEKAKEASKQLVKPTPEEVVKVEENKNK